MSVFDGLASVYDRGMLPLEWLIFRRLRRRLFPPIRGRVLELGVGTGVNLSLYGPWARVTACDTSQKMLTWAAHRSTAHPVALVQADVQCLPFAAASFDAVTGSLIFCSVLDPLHGLTEARRVLGAGKRLFLLEHTRGRGLGRVLMDLLHPLWHWWSRECHLNRETVQAVAEAGFQVVRAERYALGIVRLIEAIGPD